MLPDLFLLLIHLFHKLLSLFGSFTVRTEVIWIELNSGFLGIVIKHAVAYAFL